MEPQTPEDVIKSQEYSPIEHFKPVIDHTRDRGREMGLALQDVFAKVGFDQALVRNRGALCLDVGFGPEIEALRPLDPKVLIVTEMLDNLQPGLNGREASIKAISEDLPVEIVSGHSLMGFDHIPKNEEERVGLIMQLITYPGSLTKSYLNRLIDYSSKGLANGGMLLVSATEEDASRALEDIQKVVRFQKEKNRDIELLRLGPKDSVKAGQTFIVVKN